MFSSDDQPSHQKRIDQGGDGLNARLVAEQAMQGSYTLCQQMTPSQRRATFQTNNKAAATSSKINHVAHINLARLVEAREISGETTSPSPLTGQTTTI